MRRRGHFSCRSTCCTYRQELQHFHNHVQLPFSHVIAHSERFFSDTLKSTNAGKERNSLKNGGWEEEEEEEEEEEGEEEEEEEEEGGGDLLMDPN
ncbi:hypothetical protein EYF80_024720 [Liparis tanakae]|uniref:Uncharacterized protein n=1 Tax=Liparis tanakae TaxID=230148 RepID=A0A4Z2HHM6_9TELE|nr:hypothetical protein EYF80_024720 [Liparis tanakae]